MNNSNSSVCSILSWNCRGLKNKKPFLEKYTWENRPLCIAIQETKLKKDSNFHIPNYTYKDKPFSGEGTAQGGVAFLIHEDIVFNSIELKTNFQAIAIRAKLHKLITICNIYINPDEDFTQTELENLTKQLPTPFILTGDFNSHSTLWYDNHKDRPQRANTLENFILENNLNILDENEPTLTIIRPDGTLYESHIDLTLITPDLQLDLNWTTYKVDNIHDKGGSDHIPIIIEINKSFEFSQFSRWNFKRANWEKYRELAIFKKPITDFSTVQQLADYIVYTINNAAEIAIGKSKFEKGKTPKPWWNEQCKIATKNKRKAYRKLKRNPSILNKIEYHKANAISVRTIRISKQESWDHFLSTINTNTTSRKVWGKINALKGKNKNNTISSLKTGENTHIYDKTDIANTLGKNFQNISNGKNSNNLFREYREGKERWVDFSSNTTQEYNLPITFEEFQNILKTSGNTSPGEDGIPYEMIRKLPEESLRYLLRFYNRIFRDHTFPGKWKEAIIIPILKPGKDPQQSSSYRPIALISCLSKILEKILNKRLMWYLEKNNLINKSQCGFRRGRSTTDHLTRLTTDIQETLVDNKYHISIFLDLDKAYDCCWKQVILDQLQRFNMKGNLAFYIQNFLQSRSIKVKLGNNYSEKFVLDLGVPQGSSISVTLFLLAINTVLDFIDNGLDISLFVDDFRISLKSPDLGEDTTLILQNILNQLQVWTSKTGFKFAKGKSEIMISNRKGKTNPPKINLTLDNQTLKVVDKKKFLGVWFDNRLLWDTHIKYLKDECMRSLRLLKTIAFSKNKTDSKMLLRIYKVMILPKLEYGCLAYGIAAKTTLEKLDPIHNQALRICLGAFHTTPIKSLEVESNIHSLFYRRKVMGIKYYIRTLTINRQQTICKLYDTRRDPTFEKSTRFKSLGFKVRKDMLELNIHLPPILEQKTSNIPPWLIPPIKVCFHMENFPKRTTSDQQMICSFFEHKHQTNIDIYTDGSKTTLGVGAGIAIRTSSRPAISSCFSKGKKQLSSKSSILFAELAAINAGLDTIAKLSNTSCTVYSDSKGAIQSIQQYDPINPLVQNIQKKINRAYSYKNALTFCWVPAHCGIPGNECADKLAKQASNTPASSYHLVLARDLYSYINSQGKKWLQNQWDFLDENKLHIIDGKIGERTFPNFSCRKDEIKFNRVRFGHSRFTNKFMAGGEPPPDCIFCQTAITIKHIFTVCPLYNEARQRFFGVNCNNLSRILDRKTNKMPGKVIDFLKYTNIYSEI